VIEQRDLVRELIGLLQILSGEEDRYAVRDQVTDDLPHRPPAARVQSGGWLVKKDHPGVADQRHGQVQPALHAAGIGGCHLVRGLGHVGLPQQFVGAGTPSRPAQVMQIGHQQQVLPAGQQLVHRRVLSDRATHLIGGAGQVVSGHARLAIVRPDQRGQDLHHRGLAGAVRAEQGEDRALLDG
jgi:hypothetical protein